MKIKSLQVFGFKSFGDRSELSFDRQIAGIVGPNGCGKSNIVDAIRWAMGEQSAKGLRGTEMADVIFNGTATRKRASFAEVSIIFENNEGLAPAPYHECAEIMITRRLYRSGESEYLINKVAARLKDITDLFLGTGSNARAYSIVAQGKVDQIVLAKPEDRRFLIEEAAGIAKYKVRKLSAERKMDATRTNLERIHDITSELERSARHLERQVEKAEQFRKLQTELRQLDEQIVSAKLARLDTLAATNNDRRTVARDSFEKFSTELSSVETEIEKGRLDALNSEKMSASDYEALIANKEKFANADKEIELRSQRIQNLKNQIQEREQDIERLRSKTDSNRDVLAQLLAEREKLAEEKSKEEVEVQKLKAELAALSAEIQQKEEGLQGLRAEYDEKRAEEIKENSRREGLRSDRIEIELRRAEAERNLEDLKNRKQILEQESFSLSVQLEEFEAERMHRENDLKGLETRERELIKEHSETLEKISEANGERSQADAELESLKTLESHEVGYETGALEHKRQTNAPFLMDLIKFKSAYEKVGATFFYEFGQDFLGTDGKIDVEGLRWARLFSMGDEFPHRNLIEAVDGNVSAELEKILRSVELVDRINPSSTSEFVQIDLEGRISMPIGTLRREGLGEVQRKDTPFGRKLEMDELESKSKQFDEILEHLNKRVSDMTAMKAQIAERLTLLRVEVRDVQAKIQNVQSRMAQQSARSEALNNRLAEMNAEMISLDEKILEIDRELSAPVQATAVEELKTKLEQASIEIDLLREKKSQADGVWIEKRISFGALAERVERIDQQTIHQEMTRSEYEHNQGLYLQDIQNWTSDIAREEETIATLQGDRETGLKLIAEIEARLADNKLLLNQIRSTVEQAEVRRKDVQVQKDKHQVALQDLELEHQRLKFEVEELSQIVNERYHLTLQDLIANVTAEMLERLQDETILGSLEVDAQEIRAKIEKFGDVNLLALTEFEEIKKRLEFMQKQREDLLKTLDSLQSIIDRINKITEFRFRETFTAINHNFQILFPKLFGGGKAYMTLTDEKNLLETGVEIFAEPPGKKVQTMSLLSGGEKAMTSISLIFSLFAYRPASFCILDEVDAPLDEVNTLRYNSIIQEMAALSQFIVITHNKRTMEVAEKLFGVTMQDPGVSQLVAVELNQAKQLVA